MLNTFIDLASHGEREQYMYSNTPGENTEGTWDTHSITKLTKVIDKRECIFRLARVCDFVSYVFVDIKLPEIKCIKSGKKIFWSKNLAHNICYDIKLTSNDDTIVSMSNYDLDFNMNYNISKEKYDSYNYYIGNRPELTAPQNILNETILSLPIPFYFSKDKSKNLSTCGTPYSRIDIKIKFREWDELLTMIDLDGNKSIPTLEDIIIKNEMNLDVYGNYIVTNGGRRQLQSLKEYTHVFESFENFFQDVKVMGKYKVIIKSSNSIKNIFYSVRDVSSPNEWSIYIPNVIKDVSLLYGDTPRIDEQPAHHFSYIYIHFFIQTEFKKEMVCICLPIVCQK